MTHDQNPPPTLPCHCSPTDPVSDQSTQPALPYGCVPTVKRKKPSRKPGGRLPDRPDFRGCPPGFHWPPSSRLPFNDLYPYIPNLTPIPGTDGALNKAALSVSALGVIYIIQAWLAQAENDFVWVELNGVPVAHYTVSEADAAVGKDIVLTIESVRFIDQAFNQLQGFVRRLSGTTDQTPIQNVWVDQKEPGGPDPRASTPTVNENLARIRFDDPNIEAFGVITQAAAQLGVTIIIDKYPVNPLVDPVYHRKEGDVITVSIGGVLVSHTVTSFEASGDEPIVITIYYSTWLQVTPGVNILEWFARDKAGNQSIGFSVPRLLQNNVGGGTSPLPEPYVLESDYDAGSNEDFIDTDKQSNDLSLEVPIRNYGWLLNDTLLVTYIGLTATGETLKHIETADVLQPNALRIYVPLPLVFAKKLAGGRLQITYERVRPGEPNTRSNAAIYSMRGTPADNRRPAPIVHGLVGNTLPVDTDPVHITVPLFELNEGDKVDLIIEGKALDGTAVYEKFTEIAGTEPIDYFLDYWSTFALLEGSTFTAYYVVNNDTTRPSNSVTVQVGDISVTLPPPTSDEAPPPYHVFDELVSKGNLKALVHPHSSIDLNDQVRVVAIGSKPGGSVTTSWLTVTSVWFGSTLPFTIARSIVLANKDGTMALHWEVRTLPTDIPLKSLPLNVNVGARLQPTECPSLLEGTYESPCVTRLNPLHVWTPSPRTVTFRVTYPALVTDLVTLVIQGKPGVGMPNIPAKPGNPDAGHDYITFALNSNFVAAYLGESFTAHFEVLRNGGTVQSPPLTVHVDLPSADTLDLVSVPEATGGVITARDTNHVRVKQWPFFKAGQPVFVDLLHASGDRTVRDGVVVSAAEFTAGQTLDLIPADYLKNLTGTLTVNTWVSLDGYGSRETSLPLKPVSYHVEGGAQIIKYIGVGANPEIMRVTPDGKKLFVVNNHDTTSVVNLETLQVENTLTTPGCWGMAISRDGNYLYIAQSAFNGPSYIHAHNAKTNGRIRSISFDGVALEALVLNADGSKLYAGTSAWHISSKPIAVINAPSMSLNRYINTYNRRVAEFYPRPDRTLAYSKIRSNPGYQFFGSLDLISDIDNLAGTPPFSAPVENMAFDGIRARAYVTTPFTVEVLDLQTNKIVGRLPGFSSASGIACDPTRSRAYVTDQHDNTVTILDTSTDDLSVIETLTGFNKPITAIATPDGKYIIIANYGSSDITVIAT